MYVFTLSLNQIVQIPVGCELTLVRMFTINNCSEGDTAETRKDANQQYC